MQGVNKKILIRTGAANRRVPRINKAVKIFTILFLILKKMNCSIVLPSQKREIPSKNALPNLLLNNSLGKTKQTSAIPKNI